MLKRFWNWLLGKTTVDEKVVETYHKVEDKVAEETRDVLEAAKGAPRKGRKPAPRRRPAAKKVEATPAPKVEAPKVEAPKAEVKEAAKKPARRRNNNRKPAAKK